MISPLPHEDRMTPEILQPMRKKRTLLRLVRNFAMLVLAWMVAMPLLCTLAYQVHYWTLPVENRDGSSAEEAVIVHASNEWEGVQIEYAYTMHHTDPLSSELLDQSLVFQDGRTYDVLRYRNTDGEIETFWFDISEWYGVMPPEA